MEGEYLSLDTAKKIAEKDKEIERLNNIINELEKWLFDNKNCVPKHITDYFEKLKGENNE